MVTHPRCACPTPFDATEPPRAVGKASSGGAFPLRCMARVVLVRESSRQGVEAADAAPEKKPTIDTEPIGRTERNGNCTPRTPGEEPRHGPPGRPRIGGEDLLRHGPGAVRGARDRGRGYPLLPGTGKRRDPSGAFSREARGGSPGTRQVHQHAPLVAATRPPGRPHRPVHEGPFAAPTLGKPGQVAFVAPMTILRTVRNVNATPASQHQQVPEPDDSEASSLATLVSSW